jgi:predicted dehydrogenase
MSAAQSAKVRWGVLGSSKIGRTKVLPAMQQGELSEVVAIASRDAGKAAAEARDLGIPKSYGSYEELLADPEIEAIYNPLPNHLHVPWSIRAAEAGKHVLCEKPIGLNAAECRELMAVQQRTGVLIGEAFMVRSHPQWLRVRNLVRSGEIGKVVSILGIFSYFNNDPKNIRNFPEWGGGALLDIGCYPIQVSRFILDEEPQRVSASLERDPAMGIDRLTSALVEFPSAHLLFTCGTQMIRAQRVQVFGTKASVDIEIPFNPLPDRAARILVDWTGDFSGSGIERIEFPICNQYTLQGDAFSRAIREGGEPPTPLSDSLRNMLAIDAVFESGRTNSWVPVPPA